MHEIHDTPLRLRKFEPRDVEQLWKFRNDSGVTTGLGGFSSGYSHKDLEDWIEFHRSRIDEVLYAIVDSADDRCIGHVGLYQIDHRSQKAEFAILIGDSGYHGKGYGEQLTRFMVSYGFCALNLRKVTLSVLGTNARAASLYRKLGFVQEGVARQDEWRDGAYVDTILMSALRDEWNFQQS